MSHALPSSPQYRDKATSSNACSISLIMTNCTWTASVGSWSTNGMGISASFTPTACGDGSISFHVGATNSCDGGNPGGDAGGSFKVVAVASLAPELSSDQGGLEAGSDPPEYWVCPCPGDVIVTASSCPSLTASELPACWTFTGGTEIDKLHHKVSKTALMSGPVTFTVTCGTSTKTIVLKTDPEKDKYDVIGPSAGCQCDNWNDTSPYHDKCGNTLFIDCAGAVPSNTGGCWETGHFSYRYNGISIGVCRYPGGLNGFLYKTTKHNCRILRTWHSTIKGTSAGVIALPAYWTITKYDCVTGTGPSLNCRTSTTWGSDWVEAPADELIDPTKSIENQGSSSTPCPIHPTWQ